MPIPHAPDPRGSPLADADGVDADPAALRFAGFEFDLRRSELRDGGGALIRLRPKAEILLRHFLFQPGRLLGRDELIAAVWPAVVVTDDSLVQCVGELRAALGDQAQRLICTIPRRGYRFDAPVQRVAAAAPAAAGVPLDPTQTPEQAPEQTSGQGPAQAAESAPAPAPAPIPGKVPASTHVRPRTAIVAGALTALMLLAAAVAWRWHTPPATLHIDAEVAARHVVGVTPFLAPPDDDGLRSIAAQTTEDIAAQIATRMGMRSFGPSVAPGDGSSSGAQQQGLSKATYVVSGRVAHAPDVEGGTAIDVTIVSVADGTLIAAERFVTGGSSTALLRSDIGAQVANLLRGRMADVDHALASRSGHVLDAVDLTLLGWWEIDQRRGADGLRLARSHFEQALHEDPESAMALTGLGAALLTARTTRMPLTQAEIAESERVIEHALVVAPNDATASLLWASLQLVNGRADLALPAIEKANRLAPSYANGYLLQAQALLMLGRPEAAHGPALRAAHFATLARDAGRVSAAYATAAEAMLMRGEVTQAHDLAQRAVAERPSNPTAHAVLAATNALAGRDADAAAEMAVYRKLAPRATLANYDEFRRSREPAYLTQRARLFDGLSKAGLQ